MRLTFKPIALEDIRWVESQLSKPKALRFRQGLFDALESLQIFPRGGTEYRVRVPIPSRNRVFVCRRKRLEESTFREYWIYYTLTGDDLEVLRVRSDKQNPYRLVEGLF